QKSAAGVVTKVMVKCGFVIAGQAAAFSPDAIAAENDESEAERRTKVGNSGGPFVTELRCNEGGNVPKEQVRHEDTNEAASEGQNRANDLQSIVSADHPAIRALRACRCDAVFYREYSSTTSCSFTIGAISSRLGMRLSSPVKLSLSTVSQ